MQDVKTNVIPIPISNVNFLIFLFILFILFSVLGQYVPTVDAINRGDLATEFFP
jgi:hypothetical protein